MNRAVRRSILAGFFLVAVSGSTQADPGAVTTCPMALVERVSMSLGFPGDQQTLPSFIDCKIDPNRPDHAVLALAAAPRPGEPAYDVQVLLLRHGPLEREGRRMPAILARYAQTSTYLIKAEQMIRFTVELAPRQRDASRTEITLSTTIGRESTRLRFYRRHALLQPVEVEAANPMLWAGAGSRSGALQSKAELP